MATKQPKICGRCGGSGHYSYNYRDGSICYGCNGTGYINGDKLKMKNKAQVPKKVLVKKDFSKQGNIFIAGEEYKVVAKSYDARFKTYFLQITKNPVKGTISCTLKFLEQNEEYFELIY